MDRCLSISALLTSTWFLILSLLGMFSWNLPFSQGQEGGFAADRFQTMPEPVKINGDRAMGYLKAICVIGPRMSATPGMKKQQDLIREHFIKLGAEVKMQTFSGKQVSQKKPVEMANMIISWHPKAEKRVIICSHYDTRPIADQEQDPRNWKKPFVSANDGGSGVALLMELGHHIKDLKLNVGVDFVLFDGEEYIFDSDGDKYFFGSEHFAQTWAKNGRKPKYEAAILLDMIAGKNAKFPAEGYSYSRYKSLVGDIWQIAAKQGCKAFQQNVGSYVLDDHIALQKAGIPALDIIDFSYPHWHKLSDTPANCSTDGMDQVAKVLTVWMQTLK